MGALCGKEDHFDSLSSNGQTLGGSSNGLARQPTPHQPRQKPVPPKSSTTAQARTLGGEGGGGGGGGSGGPDREAMLRAAEARSKAAETRGTKNKGGSLSKKLEQQKADGGRADEARIEAERRGDQPLVWD
ncbi:hypothetical protein JCM16303_001941 [Sporobolomyces ruberrimus]